MCKNNQLREFFASSRFSSGRQVKIPENGILIASDTEWGAMLPGMERFKREGGCPPVGCREEGGVMFRKILVPLDGSPVAEQILQKLAEIADGDREVHLLRVANASQLPGVDPAELQVNVLREAEEYLAALEARLRGEGIRVESHVRYGHPAEEILEHIRHWNYDLVAMATHGRSGVSRLLMGSVTESVIRGATIPVLVMRATGVPVQEPVSQD